MIKWLVIAALVTSACGALPHELPQPSPVVTPTLAATHGLTFDQLIGELRAKGLSVERGSEAGSGGAPKVFKTAGWYMKIGADSITVYEFDSIASAIAAKQNVSPDGLNVKTDRGGIHSDPIATMHVYSVGQLIIFYAGCDRQLIATLESVAGPQFAGEVPGRDTNTLNHQCK